MDSSYVSHDPTNCAVCLEVGYEAVPKTFKVGDRVHYDGKGTDYFAPDYTFDGTVVEIVEDGDLNFRVQPDDYDGLPWWIESKNITLIDNSTADVDSEILTTLRNIDALLDRVMREPIEETDDVATEPVAKHTFNRAVDQAFAASQAISNQRGGEYQDSWATENQSTHFLDATLRLIDASEDLYALGDISKEAKRLLMLASLCDVKVSRMLGSWKDDTYDDLLNYLAAYTTLAKEYKANHTSEQSA